MGFKERKEVIGLVTKNKEILNEQKWLNFLVVFVNDGWADHHPKHVGNDD